MGSTLTPYSEFQAMPVSQLGTLQVKLTFVGPSDEPTPSLLITSTSGSPNIAVFVPFRQANVEYFNDDDVSFRTFSVTTLELKAIVDSVGTLPEITAGGIAVPSILAFSLYNSAGTERVFEAVTNQAQTVALFAKLRAALPRNVTARVALDEFACALGALDPSRPIETTSQVTATLSGFRLDRRTGRFVNRVTLLNTGVDPIVGPISLVLEHQAPGFQLHNRTGTTCGLAPVGRDYLTISAGALAPGNPVVVKLDFENPDRLAIRTNIRVFAGPGAR